MTIETALTVARPSAENGATLNSPSHSAASGVSRASSHANTRASMRRRWRTVGSKCRPGVAELFVVHDIPPSGSQQCLDARAEARARPLENLADRRGLDAEGGRDFARVELGAVAQAHDRALALGQLAERDEQRAPLPRAVEIVCRIGCVVGRLGQLTRGRELGTAAAKPPAHRVDGDGRDPGRETRVGTRRVLVERRQHRQHRILGHVLGIGVASQHPAHRAKHAVDVLHVQRAARAGVAGTRLFDEACDRVLGERLGVAAEARAQDRRRAPRAAMRWRRPVFTGARHRPRRSRFHLRHVADRPDRGPKRPDHRGEHVNRRQQHETPEDDDGEDGAAAVSTRPATAPRARSRRGRGPRSQAFRRTSPR